MTQKKIQVFINGKKKMCYEKNSLLKILKDLKLNNTGIAVEINYIVIPKSQ